MVTDFGARFSDGTAADLVGLKCTATLGGRRLPGQGIGGCTFVIPRHSKGKKLVVAVSGKGRTTGVAYRKAFTYVVR